MQTAGSSVYGIDPPLIIVDYLRKKVLPRRIGAYFQRIKKKSKKLLPKMQKKMFTSSTQTFCFVAKSNRVMRFFFIFVLSEKKAGNGRGGGWWGLDGTCRPN